MAFRILVMYLTWSAASLLPNIIVEKEQLASSVHISTELRPNIQISLIASSVATDKLDFVRDRIISVLQDAASSSIDLKYMRNCIRRWGRGTKLSAENTAETFATKIIEDHLFGPRDGSALHYSLSSLKALDDLEAWTDGQWQTLLSHWLANAHHVAILAEPSAEMAQKVRVDEEKRIKEQQEGLGEDGMKKLAKKLDDAKTENDKPVPPELLDSFEIPSPQSVHFITTVTARSGNAKRADVLENDVQAVVDANANGRPIFIHFEHIPSNFVQVDLLLGREAVKLELKPLVVLFKETFFKSPISRDGARIEFEHVLMEIENDTVSHRIGTGDEYDNKELLRLTFHVEPGNYSTIIKRAKELLFDSIDDHTVSARIPSNRYKETNFTSEIGGHTH